MANKLLAICLMFIVASSAVYEAQGTFLLKMYLRRKLFPRRCIDFTPYCFKGMLMLLGSLEHTCPATREFKNFFVRFRAYLQFINSVSVSSSTDIDTQMNGQINQLFQASSALGGGQSDDFKNSMLSMGKTLIEQKKRGSMIMTLSQQKELLVAMVRWTRMICTFLQTATQSTGKTIDISSYGLDVDVNKSIGISSSGNMNYSPSGSGSTTPTGGSTPTTNGNPSTSGNPSASGALSISGGQSTSRGQFTSGGQSTSGSLSATGSLSTSGSTSTSGNPSTSGMSSKCSLCAK